MLPLPNATVSIDPELVREQLKRILSDPLFHNSKRFSSLLKFIVEKTLDGQHQSLKERIIGIEVFERSPEYDPGLDAIVRVAAAEVRKRLALYYKEPAHREETRIELPIRSYIAEFRSPGPDPKTEQPIEAAPQIETKEEEKPAQPERPRPTSRRIYGGLALVAVAVILAASWLYHSATTPAALDRFWSPLLNHSEPIAVMITALQETDLQIEYRKRDLSAAATIISFLGLHDRASVLRYSQNTALDDLRRQSVVVVGGLSNQWVIRLGNGLRFQFRHDADSSWIEDANDPASRDWHTELSAASRERKEYALITRAYNNSIGQWWIGVSGLTGFGTLLAQELIVDPEAMAALSKQLPQDWAQKNLQIVLDLDVVNKSPGAPHVIATHTW